MSATNYKVAVVTEATEGMGRAVAHLLGEAGYVVLVQGRDQMRGEAVVEEIAEHGGFAHFMKYDLASLAEVRRFADDLNAHFDHIDLLINNVGVGAGRDDAAREESADGLEVRFAVNYLASYLLTRQVLDKVKAAAPARIVNVAPDEPEPIDFSDVMLERRYSAHAAASRSTVAEMMFTIDLAEELKAAGVTVNAVCPSVAATAQPNAHTAAADVHEGASRLFEIATDPRFAGVTGHYINGGVDMPAAAQCYNAEARRRLRELSNALIERPLSLH